MLPQKRTVLRHVRSRKPGCCQTLPQECHWELPRQSRSSLELDASGTHLARAVSRGVAVVTSTASSESHHVHPQSHITCILRVTSCAFSESGGWPCAPGTGWWAVPAFGAPVPPSPPPYSRSFLKLNFSVKSTPSNVCLYTRAYPPVKSTPQKLPSHMGCPRTSATTPPCFLISRFSISGMHWQRGGQRAPFADPTWFGNVGLRFLRHSQVHSFNPLNLRSNISLLARWCLICIFGMFSYAFLHLVMSSLYEGPLIHICRPGR